MTTKYGRLRALKIFEERRKARAAKDLAHRDEMIRDALDNGDPANEVANAAQVARTYVYRIRDGFRTGNRETT